MHPEYVGDSYDLVKRFFLSELQQLGLHVSVDPMFTDESSQKSERDSYRRLILVEKHQPDVQKGTVLFLDPDTGISKKAGRRYISIERIAHAAMSHTLVMSFDQSFGRSAKSIDEQMQSKLADLSKFDCHGIYYDSHARFLFASRKKAALASWRKRLETLGLPGKRLVDLRQ